VSEAKEKTDGDEKKTKEQCYTEMRSQAQAQFDGGCDTPTVTLSVDFINCADTEEYREYGFLQNIYLGDAVRVIAPRIGVWVSMRMTQYTLRLPDEEEYTQMTLVPWRIRWKAT
jgi:phage-related protein